MNDNGSEEFIGEALVPAPGSGDASRMARGEPGLPGLFTWRDTQYRIAGVISAWKTSGRDVGGGSEMYLRRHWYKVLTDPLFVMTIYCDRQAKNRQRPKSRWYIFTVVSADEENQRDS